MIGSRLYLFCLRIAFLHKQSRYTVAVVALNDNLAILDRATHATSLF